jgi:signal transduction histidine kinase
MGDQREPSRPAGAIDAPVTGSGLLMSSNTLSTLSLRLKLLLFSAALVLVPGLILALITQQSGSASLQELIGRQLAREARHTATLIDAKLRAERNIQRSFAQQDLMREIRVGDLDKRISRALATLRDAGAQRLDYLVADATRQVIASSDARFLGTLPAWIEGPVGRPAAEEIVGPLSVGGIPAPVLVFTTPVRDPDKGASVIGSLIGLYDWDLLTEATRSAERDLAAQDIETRVLVVRSDGSIIGGSPFDPPQSQAAAAEWSRAAVVREPGHAVLTDAGWLMGRASLGSEFSDWRLLIVESLADALRPARDLTERVLILLGVTLAVALLVATIAARRVVKPLTELTVAIRNLTPGAFSSLRVPAYSEDEVGTLAQTFNRMAGELDRAQKDFIDAAKFALVGELAAGVAHEVRTSLGVLRSSAQMLERALPAERSPETAELAQLIHAEVDRLGGVVNDLLELGRPHALHLEACPLSAPIARALEFVEPQAQEGGVTLAFREPEVDPDGLCDSEMIFQVVLNLLVNAVQALGRGGRVEVVIVDAGPGTVAFEVRDDGPGIPADMLDEVFRPFTTGREEGIGLGLTFVQRVIYEHHGCIRVDSEPGVGTCFRIELPTAEDPS